MSRIYVLLEKFASGTCSGEEFEELMQLLKANENEEVIRSDMRKFYNSLDSQVVSDVHIDEQGDMFQREEPGTDRGRRRVIVKRAVLALCAVFVVVTGWYLYTVPSHTRVDNTKVISRIYTPAGSRTSVVLPDGTEVWLNSLSTLTYSTAEFNSGRREVSLVGEGLFSVKHDSLHRFLVHTKNFDVADLGTVFNVSAYPEDKNARASLISGSIEVITKGSHSKQIRLVPNQRIIVDNEDKGGVVGSKADRGIVEPTIKPIVINPEMPIAPDTAWMANKLIFSDEYFFELALQMQRRYSVEISFRNEKARYYRFTGRFEEEDLEDALKELQAIAPFSFSRSNNKIYIE